MPHEWDENIWPPAYLLTFRTYGTWHHGDTRGSVDRRNFNAFRSPKMPISSRLVEVENERQSKPDLIFNEEMRSAVETAIREVCRHRTYTLLALNVRSNHVHVVVSFAGPPEKIVEAFKSYATRKLRNENLVDSSIKIWARHCSTRYLWKERSVVAAMDYVLYSQGDEFPNFDELVG